MSVDRGDKVVRWTEKRREVKGYSVAIKQMRIVSRLAYRNIYYPERLAFVWPGMLPWGCARCNEGWTETKDRLVSPVKRHGVHFGLQAVSQVSWQSDRTCARFAATCLQALSSARIATIFLKRGCCIPTL